LLAPQRAAGAPPLPSVAIGTAAGTLDSEERSPPKRRLQTDSPNDVMMGEGGVFMPTSPTEISVDFAVNIGAAIVYAAVSFIIRGIWRRLSASGRAPMRVITGNRRNYTVALIVLILLVYAGGLYNFYDDMTKAGVFWLTLIVFAWITIHLIRELSAFWVVGFNYIEKTVSASTYKDCFKRTATAFQLAGTNAYNYCETAEFDEMINRVRSNRGQLRFLLAHPSSAALQQAAINRKQVATLYQEQAEYSLGKLAHMQRDLGAPLSVHLYQADRIEDLPIFRIMLINDAHAVAAIAVYGREDHGRSLPQIYARKMSDTKDSHRCMYSVLNRYFEGFWDLSRPMSEAESIKYCEIWKKKKRDIA
jgi:hypothetical protein